MKNKYIPYILLSPLALYYLLFWVYPVLKTIISSFNSIDGNGYTLDNYITVFTSPEFIEAAINTTIFTIFSVVLSMVIATALALMVNRKFKGSSLVFFIILIPMALTPTAVGAIWSTGLATYGWVNSIVHSIGLWDESFVWGLGYIDNFIQLGIADPNNLTPWLTANQWQALFLVIIVDLWTVVPFTVMILVGGLQSLSPEAKEAGYVFGANKWQVIKDITIPMLKPTMVTASILRLIAAIQVWLIAIMIFGYDNLYFFVERIAYYTDFAPGIAGAKQFAAVYSVIVTIIVLIAAIIFLFTTGEIGGKKND